MTIRIRQLQKIYRVGTERVHALRGIDLDIASLRDRVIKAGYSSTYIPLFVVPGPDGRAYAVAGEVGIDASVIRGDPAATLAKMLQVERAALAPVDPSPQDRRVAALATGRAAEARAELAEGRGVGRHVELVALEVGNVDACDPVSLGHRLLLCDVVVAVTQVAHVRPIHA